MRRSLLAAFAALSATAVLGSIGLAGTSADPAGTMILNGQKVFPIVLAKGPDAGTTTPTGVDAFAEVAAAGVTFLKIGPATTPWTDADITDARAQDTAAAAAGLSTWVNLSTVSRATAGSSDDALLAHVVGSLTPAAAGGTAVGIWKGADEPRWAGIQPGELQFAYCRTTGRGSTSWCAGESVLDGGHHWVTIEAPRGTAASLQPYSAVTDIHGVDIYPVTLQSPTGNLHQVGDWTHTVASITPSHAVWTTLQVCASGSYDISTGKFVLPTFAQERYMAYDAIINGARSLAFYGGNIPGCWNDSDLQRGWNWTFWANVLKPLISELKASSPLAPALVSAGSTKTLTTSDASTQAISRSGAGDELWVIAARSGSDSAAVRIDGLPAGIDSGTVYTEGRSIPVVNGSFTDSFAQWQVHVYRFVPAASPPPTTTVATTTTAPPPTTTAPPPTTTAPPPTTTAPPPTTTAPPPTTTAPPPTPPPPPPPPPSSSGGGSAPANLAVSLAPSATAVQRDGALQVTALVRNTGAAAAQRAHLELALPDGLALAGAPSFEIGSGCSGTQQLDCNLDYLPNGAQTRVVLPLRAANVGRQTITATVSADSDSDPTDSAVSVAIDVAAPVVAPQVAPTTRTVSHNFSGTARADRLTGTAAADVLYGRGGSDLLRGLRGNDVLYGNTGNDTLDGGAGLDRLFGGPGNDTLRARDGQRDLVDCGPGRDTAFVDRVDRVSGCERVKR